MRPVWVLAMMNATLASSDASPGAPISPRPPAASQRGDPTLGTDHKQISTWEPASRAPAEHQPRSAASPTTPAAHPGSSDGRHPAAGPSVQSRPHAPASAEQRFEHLSAGARRRVPQHATPANAALHLSRSASQGARGRGASSSNTPLTVPPSVPVAPVRRRATAPSVSSASSKRCALSPQASLFNLR